MPRLIDADTITTDTFKSYVGENGGFISFGDAVDAIEAIPTAYDVDKVVEELTDNAIEQGIDYDIDISLDDAIEIVKRGGIGED